MKKQIIVAAVDLGAESGRVILGRFNGERLEIEVAHRFPNRALRLAGTLHWNTTQLFTDILDGLRKAKEMAPEVVAVGIDTWGVDFGILDADGRLLGVPVHYRDKRTEGIIEEVTARVPREEIFAQSGIAFWPFNTLYQLRALALQKSALLREGKTLLFTPDLLHYWLCGAKVSERSIASTSQCLAVGDDTWLSGLLESLGIPAGIMPPVVPSGTVLGELLPDIAAETGLAGLKVITPAAHDTGSAVAAAPLSSPQAAYLSSGTWSLLGVESDDPTPTEEALNAGFTNEKGVGKTYRFLQNIMGLWLVQSSRAAWAREGKAHEYGELAMLAEESTPFQAWINPNDLRFYAPDNMVAAVQSFCAGSGQPAPQAVSDVMRCLLESLAFTYRASVDRIEALKGITVPCLHIIGGGTQNRVLNQWTANALGRPVVTGPVEGTAMGNLLVQLMALGEIKDLAEARQVVRRSCAVETFEPQDAAAWQDAYAQYIQVTTQVTA
ncbi:MAG: rhamnulokinase [Armatimonadota bacterium]